MNDRSGMTAYYQKTYKKWYSWFSHIYDDFIKVFCCIFNGGFGGERRWREQLVEWINPQSEEKIIDICSGTGTLSMMLANKLSGAGKVIGIEISPAQLKIARKKKKPDGLTFIEADAQNIPFENGTFDKGVICGALHEMPREVRRNVLRATYQILRPGGSVIIFEQNKPKSRWKAWLLDLMERLNPEYPTYKDMLKFGLENEIERVGFRIIRTDVTIWEFFKLYLAKKEN